MSVTLKKADGDIVIQGSNGRPRLIGGVEKLNQDLADCLMITYDPARDFGHELDNLLGVSSRHAFVNAINASTVKLRVEEAIGRLQALQRSRTDQLNDSEAIERIKDIKVYPMGKTGYVFFVEVTPVAGPDVDPQKFTIRLGHQLLETANKQAVPSRDKTDLRS